MSNLSIIDQARNADKPKLKQVQYNGRRYAISIEPIYWDCLQDAAAELGIRLNQLISLLATNEEGPKNLAARLRLFCVRRLRRLSHTVDMITPGTDIVGLIDAVPTPCFAITQDRTIVHANQSLHQLVGEKFGDLSGEPVAKFFRIRFAERENNSIKDGRPSELVSGNVALMVPGRVSARRMVACPVPLREENRYLLVVFLR